MINLTWGSLTLKRHLALAPTFRLELIRSLSNGNVRSLRCGPDGKIYIYILMGKSRSDFFHRLGTACAETVYCFVQGSRRVTLVQKWMSYFSELEPSHLCHQEHVGAFSKKKNISANVVVFLFCFEINNARFSRLSWNIRRCLLSFFNYYKKIKWGEVSRSHRVSFCFSYDVLLFLLFLKHSRVLYINSVWQCHTLKLWKAVYFFLFLHVSIDFREAASHLSLIHIWRCRRR